MPLLPKRGAPAHGKRKSYNSARACVYLPIHVGTFTLDGRGNAHHMIELWVTGPKKNDKDTNTSFQKAWAMRFQHKQRR